MCNGILFSSVMTHHDSLIVPLPNNEKTRRLRLCVVVNTHAMEQMQKPPGIAAHSRIQTASSLGRNTAFRAWYLFHCKPNVKKEKHEVSIIFMWGCARRQHGHVGRWVTRYM